MLYWCRYIKGFKKNWWNTLKALCVDTMILRRIGILYEKGTVMFLRLSNHVFFVRNWRLEVANIIICQRFLAANIVVCLYRDTSLGNQLVLIVSKSFLHFTATKFAMTSLNSRPFTVLVEGNIGSGKTTFVEHFKQFEDISLLTEPVEEWRNLRGWNLLVLDTFITIMYILFL